MLKGLVIESDSVMMAQMDMGCVERMLCAKSTERGYCDVISSAVDDLARAGCFIRKPIPDKWLISVNKEKNRAYIVGSLYDDVMEMINGVGVDEFVSGMMDNEERDKRKELSIIRADSLEVMAKYVAKTKTQMEQVYLWHGSYYGTAVDKDGDKGHEGEWGVEQINVSPNVLKEQGELVIKRDASKVLREFYG